ncbi:MAG: DUF3794 domain-containing protein [Ruminococcus sp.]|nr:DUF3794 domain-containing protein [Ruminococcus sp.]
MTASTLSVSKETLVQTVTALDTAFEQPVEKDFVLPDYCPDVFRILKCRVTPQVISHSINGGRLTVDTQAVIKVMYLAENSGRINLLEQKMTFSKAIDLTAGCVSPSVSACARLDYVNCRVVNQRRIDIRGAYSVKVRVSAESRKQFVTSAEGAGIQLKTSQINFPSGRLCAAKRITLVEELELGGAKPPVGSVLWSGCRIERSEQRIVTGKLMIKGEASVELVYTPADESALSVETMRFSIPFSQVIDMDGLDESFTLSVKANAASCDIIPRAEDASRLECELVMLISCTAVRYSAGSAVTDAFSTRYECETSVCDQRVGAVPRECCAEFTRTGDLHYTDEALASIACARCGTGNISVRRNEGRTVISGTLAMSAVGLSGSGCAVFLENEVPFELESDDCFSEDTEVTVKNCSYHLTDDHSVEIKAELAVTGEVTEQYGVFPLEELSVLTDRPLAGTGGYALKLCFVEPGEDIWELAKRFRTSPRMITDENELSSDRTERGGMLLIPLIN